MDCRLYQRLFRIRGSDGLYCFSDDPWAAKNSYLHRGEFPPDKLKLSPESRLCATLFQLVSGERTI